LTLKDEEILIDGKELNQSMDILENIEMQTTAKNDFL
jgi:hypothetical protein